MTKRPPVVIPPRTRTNPLAWTGTSARDLTGTIGRALRGSRLAALAGQRDLFAPYGSPTAGALRVELVATVNPRRGRARRERLARTVARFTRAEPRLLRLRLTPAGRRLLRAAPDARITVTASFTRADGRRDRSVQTATVGLR